jgi:glycoprotein endo-alpha-1,2-mannosidase
MNNFCSYSRILKISFLALVPSFQPRKARNIIELVRRDSPFRKRFNLLFLLLILSATSAGCYVPQNSKVSEPQWTKRYLIGTYYYLWYPGNWREGYINGRLLPRQLPALGEYDSSDLKTIEQHIAWSSQYGIGFWAISWWPDHPELDRIIRDKIIKAKNISDIKFCIFYETSGLGLVDEKIDFTPEKTKRLISDVKDLAKNYFPHPSYLKIKGRPVIILYLSRTFAGDYPGALNGLRTALKKMGYDPFVIGDEIFWYVMRSNPHPPSTHPELSRIKFLDGITAYNMYNWAKPGHMGYGSTSSFLSDIHKLYQEYHSAIGKKVTFVPSIIPGYNDRGVRLSENHPVMPRQLQPNGEEGSFFNQALKQTVLPFVNPDIPVALITSFNEWNEGTQIEPAQEKEKTNQDFSPTKNMYTQGYTYQGYGKKYLAILQNTFMAISGRVIDDKGGKPLPKVSLKVFQEDKLRAVGWTDSQGFFNLSRLNLASGNYEVRANSPGYQEIRTEIRVNADNKATLILEMKKK